MKKTVEDFMAARPCEPYNQEKVESIIGEGITAEELIKLDLPSCDIIWALIYVWMTPAQCLKVVQACEDRVNKGNGEKWREAIVRVEEKERKGLVACVRVEPTWVETAAKHTAIAALWWWANRAVWMARPGADVVEFNTLYKKERWWQVTKALEIVQKGEET